MTVSQSAPAARRRRGPQEDALLGLLAVVGFLLLWELTARTEWLNPKYISSPTRIWRTALPVLADGSLWRHISVSLQEYVLGFAAAVVTAIPMGVALGWSYWLNAAFQPLFSALYATPLVALVPIIVKWAGIGYWSKVIVIYVLAFFPLIISAEIGVRTTDRVLLKLARSYRASQWDTFRTVMLPGAVPHLLSGMRVAAGRALVGVVVGELYASTEGVGHLIAKAGSTFNTDLLFVGIAVLVVSAVGLFGLLRRLELRFSQWRPAETHER